MEEEHVDKFVHLLLHPTEETLQSLQNKLNSKDEQWLENFLHARGLEVLVIWASEIKYCSTFENWRNIYQPFCWRISFSLKKKNCTELSLKFGIFGPLS